jgi:hypothetical protein
MQETSIFCLLFGFPFDPQSIDVPPLFDYRSTGVGVGGGWCLALAT